MIDILWFILAVLFLLDLLLVLARSSLLNVRLPYLVTLKEQREAGAERVIALLEKPRVRVSLYLWVVLAHFLLVATGAALLSQWLVISLGGALALAVVAGILVLAIEFTLEGWVLPRAESLAVRYTGWIIILDALISPISSLLMRLLGSQTMLEHRMSAVTEDELKIWAQEEHPEGSLEQGERRMIYSIFQFGETLAREVMVPRLDVLVLDVETPLEDAVQALTQSGHSRVPVYEGTADHIIGLLYAKDLLRVRLEGQKLSSIRNLLRPVYFVPETKKVDELLREMQSRSVHMALVVDEFGGIAGIITLEDIVEEIVGEIRDEYDQMEEQLYEQVGPHEYLFQGRIALDDLNEIMDAHLQKDAADTLGGFIYAQIGRVPQGGETIDVDDLTLVVEQVSRRRIRLVRAVHHGIENQTQETEKQDETEQ